MYLSEVLFALYFTIKTHLHPTSNSISYVLFFSRALISFPIAFFQFSSLSVSWTIGGISIKFNWLMKVWCCENNLPKDMKLDTKCRVPFPTLFLRPISKFKSSKTGDKGEWLHLDSISVKSSNFWVYTRIGLTNLLLKWACNDTTIMLPFVSSSSLRIQKCQPLYGIAEGLFQNETKKHWRSSTKITIGSEN